MGGEPTDPFRWTMQADSDGELLLRNQFPRPPGGFPAGQPALPQTPAGGSAEEMLLRPLRARKRVRAEQQPGGPERGASALVRRPSRGRVVCTPQLLLLVGLSLQMLLAWLWT